MEETRKYLVLQQEDIFEALTASLDFCKKSKNANVVSAKVQRVDELKKEYDDLRKEILKFNSQVKDPKEAVSTKMDSFNTILDAIYAIHFTLKESRSMSSSSKSGPTISPLINIQPLKLVHFDGHIDKWTQFKSLFDSLIHENPSIPNIQKLHYLKANVHGEAGKLIENIAIDESNYELCYKVLDERYSSPRRLLNFYLGQILNFNLRDSRNYTTFLTNHSNAVNGLKNLQIPDLADSLLFHISYLNLQQQDKQAFDNSCGSNQIPTTQDLFDFVQRRVRTSELQMDLQSQKPPLKPLYKRTTTLITTKDLNKQVCPFCSDNHRIYCCLKFNAATSAERKTWIVKNKRCLKCLGNHTEAKCQSKATCKSCSSPKHHSFLHEDMCSTQSAPQCTVTRSKEHGILLGTMKIKLLDSKSQWVTVRGLLDSASQVNLVTRSCVQNLGLKISAQARAISGVSCNLSKTVGSTRCTVNLGDRNETSTFLVLDNICSPQPNFIVTEEIIKKFKNLSLADDEFYENTEVDVLLGAELVSQLISAAEPCFIPGNPSALRTHYGYVIMGKIDSTVSSQPTTLHISNEELNSEMRRFWEIEETQSTRIESPEDIYCENQFKTTHSREANGRYQVRLPIKPDSLPLTSNRSRVFASYIFYERRLLMNPEKKKAYDKFLIHHLESDFMEVAKTEVQYLHTHHAVMKDSSSTALRVVINGSTPDSRNSSLNANLYAGPKLQATLPDILDHFRSHRFVLVADISKMFNQILIHPEDRIYQHIFWRPPHTKNVLEYEIKRLSFGHVSSPWLALRVVKQLVADEGKSLPKAAFSLNHCTYIDDILTGANSVAEAQELIQELILLLSKGGFELRKWISNCPELLSGISSDDLETPRTFKDDSSYFKVLGVTWLPKEDAFSFNTVKFDGTVTKRNIMSYIARLFDPCGWCSPVTLRAKTFIQKSWCLGISWDEEVPTPLASQWLDFVKDFKVLQNLRIPRNLFHFDAKYRLLGFSDGSTEAYGCCVYLQTMIPNNSKCQLLRAKSRVCPLRTISIPRIELLAAHLLTKLTRSIAHEKFPFPIEEVYYFTDSEIVLCWINSSPHTLTTFVANRVSDILQMTNPSQWRHVKGLENPSDPISRGLHPKQLTECSIYWNGPSFVSEPISNWPKNYTFRSDVDIPELKKRPEVLNVCEETTLDHNFSRFSKLTKLQNVLSYVKRFIWNCRHSDSRRVGPLSGQERREGLLSCAYLTQQRFFQDEINLLKKDSELPKRFRKLTPFLDPETDLIRAGGRLRNSDLSYNAKHPILLPKDCYLAKLLCDHYHIHLLHSGPQLVQATIQRSWWIFSLRSLLRRRIFSCLQCYRLKTKPLQPVMADLPASRTRISRVFSNVGTDFCGPFTVKESQRRKSRTLKSYMCIFVCLCTKAVHLELVSELSTAAFMACFDRFTSRRSLPSCVYSDRGTNYQGASNKIKTVSKWLEENKTDILSQFASRSVEWKFSPPNAPNFGGIWESVVKISKNLLLRTIGARILTFEELSTVFTKIEAILNSRPLTPLSTTPDDQTDFLTPGHFLVGGPLVNIPEEQVLENATPRTRWIMLQQLTQAFWRRWSNEYLQTLLPRSKWTTKRENVSVGQIVYLTRMSTTPLSWPLGRITDTHPGKDGVVRVVTVKTASGSYLRPVNSLISLP